MICQTITPEGYIKNAPPQVECHLVFWEEQCYIIQHKYIIKTEEI